MKSERFAPSLFRRFRRDDSAQAAVEFALIVPLLVIMLLGIVDFAKLFQQYQIVTDAAREAARMAVIANDKTAAEKSPEIRDAISQTLSNGGIDPSSTQYFTGCQSMGTTSSGNVEVYECDWGGARGTAAKVGLRVPYYFQMLGPFIGWAVDEPRLMMSTSVTMRNE